MPHHDLRSALLLLCGVLASASAQAADVECKPTSSNEQWIANEELRVGNLRRIVFEPGGPGFQTPDGALGWKVLWERLISGQLSIEGRRLDEPAPPLRAEIAEGYGDRGIQPTYVIFPTPGCWQITAKLDSKPLVFVVSVKKIGDGPKWRRG
jgi:hypothetical protein